MIPLPSSIITCIIVSAITLAVGGAIGWHERGLRVPAELQAQRETDQKACQAAQQLTKDANDAIQKDRDAIARRLNSLRLSKPSSCVHVPGNADIRPHRGEHAGQDGTSLGSDWLREYAAEAETYRAQLVECIQFLKNERFQK